MGTVLRGGTLLELEPACVETGDIRVVGGRIVARGQSLTAEKDDEVIDVSGRLVLPGLVSAHHHLYAMLLRGVKRGGGFASAASALERLEDVLGGDEIEASAAAGGLEGLEAGVTTVINVHASPASVAGSLNRVAHGLNGVGLRAVLGYQVTERRGAAGRDEAIEECLGFAAKARGRFRGAIALGGLAALSDEGLARLKSASDSAKLMVLANLAEDPGEEKACQDAFGKSPVERLLDAGLVSDRSVFSQNVNLAWPDLSQLLGQGAWLVHAPRSNMANQAGVATAAKFGVRGCVGTDTMPLDVLAEAQAALLRSTDAALPIDLLRFLANGHRLASELFGAKLGPLREGALADLVVLDYLPPTPLDDETLAHHVLHGLTARHVESVMVDGLWRLWKRKPLAIDPAEVARASREAAKAAWNRMAQPAAAD